MEREIKFRAWHKDRKKMIFWGLFDTDRGYHIGEGTSVDDYPIMQYTGRKDKNGKEIYEGDVLRDIRSDDTTDVIEWGRYGFTCKDYDEEDNALEYPEYWEIIGNIYENPELVK